MRKIVDNKNRKTIKYYSYLISDELEDIKGLEKYNIDNEELDSHYINIIDYIIECREKLELWGHRNNNKLIEEEFY